MAGRATQAKIKFRRKLFQSPVRLVEGVNYTEGETPERISPEPVLKIYNEALAEQKSKR